MCGSPRRVLTEKEEGSQACKCREPRISAQILFGKQCIFRSLLIDITAFFLVATTNAHDRICIHTCDQFQNTFAMKRVAANPKTHFNVNVFVMYKNQKNFVRDAHTAPHAKESHLNNNSTQDL